MNALPIAAITGIFRAMAAWPGTTPASPICLRVPRPRARLRALPEGRRRLLDPTRRLARGRAGLDEEDESEALDALEERDEALERPRFRVGLPRRYIIYNTARN